MCHLIIDGKIQQVAYHSDGRLPEHLMSEAAVAAQAATVSIPFASGEREPIRQPDFVDVTFHRSHGARGRTPHDAPTRHRTIRNFLRRMA
jgi:hypothetical protein